MYSYIRSISYYLPENIYSNEQFFDDFPDAERNKENLLKIGVRNRHIIAKNETASDMAVKAAEKLFEEHPIDRSSIDFVLFCAQEFDYYTPTTACVIQDRLGLPTSCGALDFNLGCSGFVYGLSLAKGLIESVGRKNVLLLTSSALTRTFHPEDKSSRYVFGDGAAATLISGRNEAGIGNFIFGTDGKGKDKIIVRDGGARNPIGPESHQAISDEYGNITSPANFYMNGTSVFLFGLHTVPKLVRELLTLENRTIDEVDLFIFHQANVFLIGSICKKLGIPKEKVFNFMENTGNTVSSTIPMALHEAIHEGKVKKGDTVLTAGFGVGLSWAACLFKL